MNKYYNYWNDFVMNWLNSGLQGPNYVHNSIAADFKKPNASRVFPDLSLKYIPEPWWGNYNSDIDLYSVCVNLNPGGGNPTIQSIANTNLKNITNYTDLFKLLPDTDNWHNSKRAQPICRALAATKSIQSIPNKPLDHHLSIELIPWHTMHADNAHGYWQYISSNIKDVFENSFMFAVNESRRITGPLKNRIIFRFCAGNAIRIFKMFKRQGLIGDFNKKEVDGLKDPNVHATIFTFPNTPVLTDIHVISIWRSRSQNANDFPKEVDMNDIFTYI